MSGGDKPVMALKTWDEILLGFIFLFILKLIYYERVDY